MTDESKDQIKSDINLGKKSLDLEIIRKDDGWYIRKDEKLWGPTPHLVPYFGNIQQLNEICKALDITDEDEKGQFYRFVLTSSINALPRECLGSLETVELAGNVKITPLIADYKPVHPSIGFVDDTAFIGVWFPSEVTLPPKKKGEDPRKKIRDSLFLVTDKRETILANDEILQGHGWKLSYKPVKLKGSWPVQQVKAYLDGYQCDPQKIFDQVLKAWHTYIEFPDLREYILHALWDEATFFHILFKTFPYLYIGGIKRSGKSKALTLHNCLSFNAFFSNNMSTSSIYRLIQNAHGTLLIDETEKLSNPERALEFRSILLSGYKRGAVVFRIEKTTKEMLVPSAFEIFGPKAIANIKGIEDVMEDRCITTIMKRGKDQRITNKEIDIQSEHWSELRSELTVLFLQHWHDVKVIYDQISEFSELNELVNFLGVTEKNLDLSYLMARELELWKPILVMAKFFDGVLSKFTNSVCSLSTQMLNLALEKAKQKHIENMTETGEVILVQVLLKMVKERNFYKVKDIRDTMQEQFDEEQKWINTRWVGNALRRLGFTEKRRVGTGYEYMLTLESVVDQAERMGLETPQGMAISKIEPITEREEMSKLFTFDEIVGLVYLLEPSKGTCGYCGKEATLTREVQTFKGKHRICESCGVMIAKEIGNRETE